ncbi:hypothetical protein [Paucimonas lemoignei]|nr:hypothetical protein [Paucimonas lemoignei]
MKNAKAISLLLRKRAWVAAIAAARKYAETASYADIEAQFSQMMPQDRRAVLALLADVLSDYPHCVWGVPVLFYYKNPACDSYFHCPIPEFQPDPDITAMSWLPLDILRRDAPLKPTGENVSIPPHSTELAILVACTDSRAKPQLEDRFWAEYFQSEHGSVRLSAGEPLPLPEAVEAGCAALVTARNGAAFCDTPRLFLTDVGFNAALDLGIAWRRGYINDHL